jgi:Secretion system C-terminal sorting domain
MKTLQFFFFCCFLITITAANAQTCWSELPQIQGNKTVCIGKRSTLTATNASAYTWSTGETSAQIQIMPLAHQIYFVTVTNEKGCTAVLSQAVSVVSLALKPMQSVIIAKGKSATVGFLATQLKYEWNTAETTPQITVNPLLSTIYTVTASTRSGCSASSEVVVEVEMPSETVSETAALSESTPTNFTEKITKTVEKEIEKTGASPILTPIAETTTPKTAKIEVPRTAISMYPNPVTGSEATLKLVTTQEDLNATIVISDMWGRTLHTQHAEVFVGTNYLKLNVNGLGVGSYVVRIVSNTLRFDAQKMVKTI